METAIVAKAETNDKIMQAVEKELEKNPDLSVDELFEKARKVDKSVEKLTKRQFNARYPLQVKRRKGATKKKATKKRGGGRRTKRAASASRTSSGTGGNREAVRATFMKFASEMAAAEERRDLVKFLAGVDRYVDEVLKGASR